MQESVELNVLFEHARLRSFIIVEAKFNVTKNWPGKIA